MELNAAQRADYASQVMNNPLWDEAFDELERAYVEVIKGLSPTDAAGLRHYKEALSAVSFIKSHFMIALTQGELSAREAELEEPSNITRLIRKF